MSSPKRFNLPVVPAINPHGCVTADPHANEFRGDAGGWDARFSRRDFLATMGASLALAGVTGCTDRPDEAIVPYVDPPEQVIPGEPQFFATTLTRGGYGRGVIVTSREGRPVKIEGNPDHPASRGACDAITQASILSLYDPLRSAAVTQAGVASTWGAFVKALGDRARAHAADGGAGLAILMPAVGSPTLGELMAAVATRFPQAVWATHEPLSPVTDVTGEELAFGRPADVVYDLSACDVIVSFDGDFLNDQPGSVAYARQFADARRVSTSPTMNRLYVAEADFSITGTRADHRLAVRASRVAALVSALATQMGTGQTPTPPDLRANEAEWLSAVANDLHASRGRGLVIAGPGQPPQVRAMALAINQGLGNVGKTVRPIAPVLERAPGNATPLAALVDRMRDGRVSTLLILADDPARTAPADLAFDAALADFSRRVDSFSAHLGLHANQTAFDCQWHVPAQHDLELWSDARAFDGTVSLVQPLIAPMTQGRSPIEVFNVLLGQPERSPHDTVRAFWQGRQNLADEKAFETWWDKTLQRGTVEGTAAKTLSLTAAMPAEPPSPATMTAGVGMEIVFRPDASIADGSLFHNAWLQELPRPLTKIVWGNAALISPETAQRRGIADGDVITLGVGGRSLDIPAVPLPGIADDVAVLHLGYGGHRITNVDANTSAPNIPYGTDAYPLRTTAAPWFAADVAVTLTGRKGKVFRSHNHHALAAEVSADPSVKTTLSPEAIATPATSDDDLELHNRKLIRTATFDQFVKTPDFARKMESDEVKSLYPGWDYSTGPQWGMTIDLTACIGCNACIVACQSENNIPVVGPDQVDRQRDMHWIRIDSYLDSADRVHHQPVPCMHCEIAPCEYVCPVAATTHSVEGLNQMTYNRCVGTRYCSNNCPYKVRRFNFLNYTFYQPDVYKMQKNPDVTVRGRGVMEKCTYCVQRVNYAQRKTEIAVLNAGVEPGGELQHQMLGRVQTACQQTCPTNAIHFGDLTDANAQVVKDKKSPLNYGILVELTTKPRTTYLASVTNPSPSMGGEA